MSPSESIALQTTTPATDAAPRDDAHVDSASEPDASVEEPTPGGTSQAPPQISTYLHQAQERTRFLIGVFGSQKALADLLGVSASQPSRWKTGHETPSPERGRELLDLDYVMARATMLWPAEAAVSWLVGSNAFLEGARPIDVLRTRGSRDVIAALDATLEGAFA